MKIKRINTLFALLLIMFMTVSSSIPANAATLYGYGFASRPITVYASNSLSAMEVQQLQEAIVVWNSTRVGTVLQYGGKTSLLSYYWLSDGKTGVIKSDIGGRSTGITSVKVNASKTNIIEADISLNTNVTYNNGSTISGEFYLKSVLIHELGHVLGLAHSSDYSSVMYEAYTGRTALSPQDINDLDSLY